MSEPKVYIVSESLLQNSIDDYIANGDEGPWWDCVSKSAYDQAIKELGVAVGLIDELEGVLKNECWCPTEPGWDQEVIVCDPCKALEKIAQFKGGKG
jgi:hypothetical protein